MKHPKKRNIFYVEIVITGALAVFLLVIQSATALDYGQFIFRPQEQKQSFLEKYFLKHFQQNLFDGSYAIVIAVGDYDNLPRLESVRSDAEKMKNFLLNTADYDEVVVLKDADASFDAIRYFMEVYFPTKMMEGRYRFLFYFSGHGTQRQGISGPIGYLQLKQANRQLSLHAINMNHIENWAEQFFHAKHVLFLIDACFSGLAGIEDKSYETGLDLIDLAQENGRFMITAGGADETSIASLKKWQGSLFTDVVLHGMRGNADMNRDGVITIHELFSYTQAAVSNEAQKSRHSQHPLISNLGSYRDKSQYFFVYQYPDSAQIEPIEILDDEKKKQTGVIVLRNALKTISSEDAELAFGLVERKFDWGTGRAPQNYIDNQFEQQGEVVLDHATGLMWQQAGSENFMNYGDALKYVKELNRQKFAGHNDWRIPTLSELISLLNPEKQSNGLFFDPIFDKKQEWCWSADVSSSRSAWGIRFQRGYVDWYNFKDRYYIRCVRSNKLSIEAPTEIPTSTPTSITVFLRNKPKAVSNVDAKQMFNLVERELDWGTGWVPQNYIDNQFEQQSEVVLDHATGLMWQQAGSENFMNYGDALKYVEELNRQKFVGYDNWRLPTIPELMSLLEPEKQSNDLFIAPIFNETQIWCWSTDTASSESAWSVRFRYGLVRRDYFRNTHYVRCVRS